MKILYVTTIGVTMSFFPEHIKMLIGEGHTVELACNFSESAIPSVYAEMGLVTHNIPFSRSPLSPANVKAYKQLKRLVTDGGYDVVHTHTPNASAIVRLACRKLRKKGLKVFYTAHGFHFYKGAPLKNWLLYYPIEKLCSRWTDMLITINDEDYARAKKMRAKQVRMIPGVGVDLEKFKLAEGDKAEIKRELGIAEKDSVLIYVGELNKNKNQTSLIDMLAKVKESNPDVCLTLVGRGPMQAALEEKAEKLGVRDGVIFTGFRKDIPRLLKAADICVPSSIREGFGINVVEAMVSKVPVVAYDNRGHRTIIKDGETGYIVQNGDHLAMAERVLWLLENPEEGNAIAEKAYEEVEKYGVEPAVAAMKTIYQGEEE